MRKLTLTLSVAALALAGTVAAQPDRASGERAERDERSGPITREQHDQRTAAMFARLDANGDGVIDARDRAARNAQRFDRLDADGNGEITMAEMQAAHTQRRTRGGQSTGQPDPGGFGLTRRCWQAIQPWLRPFHRVYAEIDYQARPHLRIVELYAEKGVSSLASSQDVAKTMACAELGWARINTDVPYARYIGAQGESFREDRFAAHGFDAVTVAETMPERPPQADAALIAQVIEEKRAACARHRRESYEAGVAEMRRHMFNPDTPATRQDVEWLWRVVMDRVPTDDAYYEKNVGRRTLRQIRRSLLRSREAQAKGGYLA
ncbi:hypothetical protein J4558_14175 [Leptolyngbya sp. 15MV]|nr:hypothetical protein J4558_14175 [Leptolyngbya sp. 15MV]